MVASWLVGVVRVRYVAYSQEFTMIYDGELLAWHAIEGIRFIRIKKIHAICALALFAVFFLFVIIR